MSATDPRAGRPGGGADTVLAAAAAGTMVVVLTAINAGPRAAALLRDGDQGLPNNPVALAVGVLRGDVSWSATATAVTVAFVLAVVAIAALGVRRWRRVDHMRKRVDRGVRWMAKPHHYASLLPKDAEEKSRSLGVRGAVGIPIGRSLRGRQVLYMSFEDVAVDIWGPRTGKTTARAIPMICAAPGAVVATSNKRDLVDATRGVRETTGAVWVFDPQRIVEEDPSWWWNPLTYVNDEVKAEALADVFIASSTDVTAKKDAYFDSAGKQLFKQLLLAAALDEKPITQIYLWLSNPLAAKDAVEILYTHRHPLLAAGLEATLGFSERQRSGLFGTALNYCSFLTNDQAMRWVTADRNERRPHLDPAQFVQSTQTLYLVSQEGNGSTAALVTALTMAVCEAAERLGRRSPRGRMPVPMVVVLDEAANICRWRELPNLYSHYGSRGICVTTILQSWSQGAEVWGREGMNKLWSAANIKIYGGGVSEVETLKVFSELIGDYELATRSITTGRGPRSTQQSGRRQAIFDVSDLAALDRGRQVIFSSGNPAVLAATTPWFEPGSPHRQAVQDSLAKYDPGATRAVLEPPALENPWLTGGTAR